VCNAAKLDSNASKFGIESKNHSQETTNEKPEEESKRPQRKRMVKRASEYLPFNLTTRDIQEQKLLYQAIQNSLIETQDSNTKL